MLGSGTVCGLDEYDLVMDAKVTCDLGKRSGADRNHLKRKARVATAPSSSAVSVTK
jgi:hypothetical protein